MEANDENEIACSFAFGWKRGIRARGGGSGDRSGTGLPCLRLLCSAASGLCSARGLRSTGAGAELRMGGWLLVSLRRAIRVARRLLGSSAICRRGLGGPALLRASVVRRALAPLI